MSDGTFVESIRDLATKNQIITDEKTEISYSPREFHPILPYEAIPDSLFVSSLDSLIGYLSENIEGITMDRLMVIVNNPESVDLIEAYKGIRARRVNYMRVTLAEKLPKFPFDHYLDPEDFLIKARAMFLPSKDLETIITMVSKLTVQNEVTTSDDGMSQQVSVKKGISGGLAEKESTKGKYFLAPYRTFREVEQPVSEFILRFQAREDRQPKVALFDSAGGMWRLQAMQGIHRYIMDCFEALKIDILVLA